MHVSATNPYNTIIDLAHQPPKTQARVPRERGTASELYISHTLLRFVAESSYTYYYTRAASSLQGRTTLQLCVSEQKAVENVRVSIRRRLPFAMESMFTWLGRMPNLAAICSFSISTMPFAWVALSSLFESFPSAHASK